MSQCTEPMVLRMCLGWLMWAEELEQLHSEPSLVVELQLEQEEQSELPLSVALLVPLVEQMEQKPVVLDVQRDSVETGMFHYQ